MRVYWTKWALKLGRANNHWKQHQFKRECIFTNTLVEYNNVTIKQNRHAMYQAHPWSLNDDVHKQIECHGFIVNRENRIPQLRVCKALFLTNMM